MITAANVETDVTIGTDPAKEEPDAAELYTEMLIPDLVGDVANLIEELHRLVEDMHYAMRFNYYSRLELPEFVRADAKELAKLFHQP